MTTGAVLCFVCGFPSCVENENGDQSQLPSEVVTVLSSPALSQKEAPNKKISHIEDTIFIASILFGIPRGLVFPKRKSASKSNSESLTLPTEIELCHLCHGHVVQAREIYKDLLDALRKFRRIQNKLVKTLKDNWRNLSAPTTGYKSRNRMSRETGTLEKWKRYIMSSDYRNDTDDFLLENLCRLVKELSEFLPLPSLSPSLSKSAQEIRKSEVDYYDVGTANKYESYSLEMDNNEFNDKDDRIVDEIKEEKMWSSQDSSEEEDAEWMPKDFYHNNSKSNKDSNSRDPLDVITADDKQMTEGPSSNSGSESDEDCVPIRRKRKLRKSPLAKTLGRGSNLVINANNEEARPITDCSSLALNKSEDVKFRCANCTIEFSSNRQLLRHNAKFHPELKCDQCGKVVMTERGLTIHLKRNHNISRRLTEFKCSEESCDRVFKSPEALKVHISKHRSEPGYQCAKCGISFYAQQQLRRHDDKVHVDAGTRQAFVCKLCEKSFTSGAYLSTHITNAHRKSKEDERGKMKMKTKTKCQTRFYPVDRSEQICEMCGKKFFGKQCLHNHIRYVHENRFPFYCDVCSKGVTSNVFLKIHLFRVHNIGTGEEYQNLKKPEAKARCMVVGCRKFIYGNNAEEKLQKHVTEEHGEDGNKKRYKCHICAAEFSLRYKFTEHVLIHENKETRPFKCETCGKGFANRGNMRYHQLNTHKAARLINRKKETRPRLYLHKTPRIKHDDTSG